MDIFLKFHKLVFSPRGLYRLSVGSTSGDKNANTKCFY